MGRRVAVAALGLGLVLALTVVVSPAPAGAGDGPSVRSTAAAKKKALAKCQKIKARAKRKTCISQVTQRFRPAVQVEVRDDYFSPDDVSIRSGRRITWDWGTVNGGSHNVMLDPFEPQPSGLTSTDYFRLDTGQNYAINKRWTRDLTKLGTYNFYCSLHSTVMKMKVRVSR